MRRVTVIFSLMTAVIFAGCDTGEYFQGDESAGNDSGWHDAVSLPDVATQPDTGSTTNELRLYKSGTRIKAKVFKTADGAQAFAGWYDTELKTDCFVSESYLTKDGKIRYLPTLLTNVNVTQYFYSDSACKKRIYSTGSPASCADSIEWAMVMTPSTQCNQYRLTIYRDSQKYSGSTIYTINGETCSDFTASYKSLLFLSDLGEEVDPSIFAEATPAIVD